jgi:hypothetical protein
LQMSSIVPSNRSLADEEPATRLLSRPVEVILTDCVNQRLFKFFSFFLFFDSE